MGKYTRLH